MTLPKILYHGTTMSRYATGIQLHGLQGDLPRHLLIDAERHFGNVFLCETLEDAAFYALLTYAFDKHVPQYAKMNEMNKAGIVIGVRTSNIRKTIEIDPERAECEADYKKCGLWETAKKFYMRGNWYKLKGNIPTKYILPLNEVRIFEQRKGVYELIQLLADEKIKEAKDNMMEDLMKQFQEQKN